MNKREAARIFAVLLDGVNPATGEILPADHVCKQADVVCAFRIANELMNPKLGKAQVNNNGRLNAGRPWTRQDRDTLIRLYQNGKSIETMCHVLVRRKRGVERQLAYLGLARRPVREANGKIHGRAGQPWTAEEEEFLREQHRLQRPIREIAASMGRSQYAIFCRMEKLQLYGDVPGYPQ